RYPGLATHPQHALAARQMRDYGTIVTVELDSAETAIRFSEALELFAISAGLGSAESLVGLGRMMRARDLDEREHGWAGLTDATVRLSIGFEDAGDLIADLEQALGRA